MLNRLLPISIFISVFLFAAPIFASSNIQVATDFNFANQTTNFGTGQTIYVKVTANNPGDTKRQLNLRDNQYNQITTYNLEKSLDKFTTNFPAPQSEGYYSLEAQIQSGSSIATSVKTIKVGNPTNANIKVNVQNKVEGQSVTINQRSPVQKNPTPTPVASPSISPSPSPLEVLSSEDVKVDQTQRFNLLVYISNFFQKLWQSIWPFK